MTEKNSRKTSKNPPQNPPKSTSVGKAVKYFRGLTNLSQENFAEVCGVGKNTLQRIERGKVNEPHLPTINRIIKGCQNEGLEVDHDIFNTKVAEFEQLASSNGNLNYHDTYYKLDTNIGRRNLVNLLQHFPTVHKTVSEISRNNSEIRFVRGITNIMMRIKKMAEVETFEQDSFCKLVKQLDSFVQEAERKKLKNEYDIFPLKSLREKLNGFESELKQFYPEYKDGLIPNDWPRETIKHQDLIDALFSEIQQLKLKIQDNKNADVLDKAIDILQELEIELDRDPLHLKNINDIQIRLSELDPDIFKELLISAQLLLGTFADQLPPGSSFRDTRDAPEMVVIPSGEFLMGSSPGDVDYEQEASPAHVVTISKQFAVGRYPVTFEEWDYFRQKDPEAHNPDDEGWGRERRPVINVSWEDIKDFLGWLEEKTGTQYRLLSEAEWEYSCLGGADTQYYFGNGEYLLTGYAWYSENSEGRTQPIGQRKANLFGLYDMHGNIWEWCDDTWHDSYEGATTDGSAWIEEDDDRTGDGVLRGGSYCDISQKLRGRFRDSDSLAIRSCFIGFRVARTLKPG